MTNTTGIISDVPVGPSAFHRPIGGLRRPPWLTTPLLPADDDHGDGGDGGDGGKGDGGKGDGGDGGTGAGGGKGGGGDGEPTPTQALAEKYGFPADTRVAEMTDKQQAAYFRASKDTYEARLKTMPSAEELTELRRKADAHDALNDELLTDHERELKNERARSDAAAAEKANRRVLSAELRAAVALRLPAASIQDWIDKTVPYANVSAFLGADGEIDTDKVVAYVETHTAAPGRGINGIPLGPSAAGQGVHRDPLVKPGAAGAAEAERRYGDKAKKTATTSR